MRAVATHTVGELWCVVRDGVAISERGEVFTIASRASKGASVVARSDGPGIELSGTAIAESDALRERIASAFLA